MKSDQDLYKKLRDCSKEQLWSVEVPRFNTAAPRERLERVAVIRAVGSLYSRIGTEAEKGVVREWLTLLLSDPQEKIRRYAMTALPKIGATTEGEAQLISLLKNSDLEREKLYLGKALEKMGGAATLALAGDDLNDITAQKVKAAVLRKENPGSVNSTHFFLLIQEQGFFCAVDADLKELCGGKPRLNWMELFSASVNCVPVAYA